MTNDLALSRPHLPGDQTTVVERGAPPGVSLDSFGGPVRIKWDEGASLTPLGQLPFFVDFLKTAGLFDAFIADCPLRYTSGNAPGKRDVFGTAMLSILSGHKHYAHIAALRGDGVLPELLDMKKIVSEDSVRRGFAAMGEAESSTWLQGHLDHCTAALLAEPWVLDMDTTVKPLYGHQQGAVVGYNPKKPGRPSHTYHTFAMAGTRLIIDVDVRAGNQHASNYSAPGLWAWFDRTPRDQWPALVRGDAGFGNEAIMREAEQRDLPYLFKLRLTSNVKRMIARLSPRDEWVDAGQGWGARESEVRLEGWGRQRRVIVLRRPVTGGLATSAKNQHGQQQLCFADIAPGGELYEYQVLATTLEAPIESFGQLYRDRGDDENIFDELKNQWGWGGFTTHDLARCRLSARLVALIYNWWNIFSRLAEPDRHLEAVTSRPLLLHAVASRTKHARLTTITIASSHAKAGHVARALRAVATFLRRLVESAEQLKRGQIWTAILARAFQKFLEGRPLRPPPRLVAPA